MIRFDDEILAQRDDALEDRLERDAEHEPGSIPRSRTRYDIRTPRKHTGSSIENNLPHSKLGFRDERAIVEEQVR